MNDLPVGVQEVADERSAGCRRSIGGFLRLVANIGDIEKPLGDGVKRISAGKLK